RENSHGFVIVIVREFLFINNPRGIKDVIFGLLDNESASRGAGDITNLDCLQQEIADQAFSNAKDRKNLRGMAGALLFQALQRNVRSQGEFSARCNQRAVNAEIAALTRHQDASWRDAGALNKAIVLELARQLASIGADPELALLSGTFAASGVSTIQSLNNYCDNEDLSLGCIFSQNLLVLDASRNEIAIAVSEV
ncbi:hypothetical protein BGZ63DRAFT_337044, partial [Mariannaea sp. PMI_226]